MSDQRIKTWQNLTEDTAFDVVIVGGGVNGIGTYRELALEGLRVLLVEREDFASGCSAAPSRMIHGGLRYLENGEFDLVRESLKERDALLRNASHMVHPLPTVIPITSVFSGLFNAGASFLGLSQKPARRGALTVKIGLWLYDWVTRKRRLMPRHDFSGPAKTRKTWPSLTSKARYTATFFDAWIGFPERLCVEMLRDVEGANQRSLALNYTELCRAGTAFQVTCQRTGAVHQISAKLTIYATGAWLDETVKDLGDTDTAKMVEGTKGSHLILDHPDLFAALDGKMIYFENDDGRVCIVFPFHDRVLAGSTDIRVKTPGRTRCEPEERDYILSSLSSVFPGLEFKADQIVFSYSGVRPLPKSDQDFTGRISRGHAIQRLHGALPELCMIGGKWTTFRAFAEQAADEALAILQRSRVQTTFDLPIGGGGEFQENGTSLLRKIRSEFGLSATQAMHLVKRYGSHANTLAQARAEDPRDLASGTEYTHGEIAHLIRTEYVATVSDLALRRTDLAISGVLSTDMIDALAECLAKTNHLTPTEIETQKQQLISELEQFHGVSADTLISRNKKGKAQCA